MVEVCDWISNIHSTLSHSWQPLPQTGEWLRNDHMIQFQPTRLEGVSSEKLLEKISPFLDNKSRIGRLLLFFWTWLSLDWHLELLQPDLERHLHRKEKRKGWKGPKLLKFSFDPMRLEIWEIKRPIWIGSFLQLVTKSILTDTQWSILADSKYQWIDLNSEAIIMSSCSGYQLSYSGHPFDFLSPGSLSNLVPMDYMYQDFKFFLALKYHFPQKVCSAFISPWAQLHTEMLVRPDSLRLFPLTHYF